MDDLRAELNSVVEERNRLAAQLCEQEAAHEQFARERADERSTFTRLLEEASSNQRELTEKLDEQRRQIETLRDAVMRARSFAREIMHAHETAVSARAKSRE